MLMRDHTVLLATHTFIRSWNKPYLPLLRSCRASLHFGWYSLSVWLRVEGWVGPGHPLAQWGEQWERVSALWHCWLCDRKDTQPVSPKILFQNKTDRHPFKGPFSRTTWVSRHQKVKPISILMKQEITRLQWHQLDHMQIIFTSLQTNNHASTSSLKFLQAIFSSWCPANSFKALTGILFQNKRWKKLGGTC